MFELPPQTKDDWINTPPGPTEWALDQPPPDKRNFVEFLEQNLGIKDFDRQKGLWSAVMFSSSWLLLDPATRPNNRSLRRRLKQLHGYTDKLIAALSRGDITDEWIIRLLQASEPAQSATSVLEARNALTRLKRVLGESEAFLNRSGPGRRKDETLWTWVEHIQPIWSIVTQLPASVDYHDGHPVTPYALFTHKAIEMLAPERAHSLQNVLVRHRTRQNRTQSSPDYPG